MTNMGSKSDANSNVFKRQYEKYIEIAIISGQDFVDKSGSSNFPNLEVQTSRSNDIETR